MAEASEEQTHAVDRFLHDVGLAFPRCPTLIQQAIAAAQNQEWKRSADLYARLCARHPKVADYWQRLAAARLAGGKEELARRAAEKSIALDPNFAPARVVLGLSLLMIGKRQDALTAFEQAIAIAPDNLEAQGELRVLRAHDDPSQVLAASDQLLAIDPSDSRHQFRLAMIAKRAGLGEAELTIFERTRDIAARGFEWDTVSDSAEQLWVAYATRRDRERQFEAAKQWVESVRKIEPPDLRRVRRALLVYGLTLSASDPAGALAVLDEAKEIPPHDERDRLDELSRRVLALDLLSAIEEERRVATEMVEAGRRNGDSAVELQGMRHLAYCYLADGEPDRAMREMDDVLGRYAPDARLPDEPSSLSAAASVAWLAGHPDRARELLEKALNKTEAADLIVADAIRAEADLVLGSIALDEGKLEEAESRLVKAADSVRRTLPAAAAVPVAEVARLRVAQNRLEEARALIDEARTAARRPEAIRLVERAAALLAEASAGDSPG